MKDIENETDAQFRARIDARRAMLEREQGPKHPILQVVILVAILGLVLMFAPGDW